LSRAHRKVPRLHGVRHGDRTVDTCAKHARWHKTMYLLALGTKQHFMLRQADWLGCVQSDQNPFWVRAASIPTNLAETSITKLLYVASKASTCAASSPWSSSCWM
jgi:hypothetical protein